MDHLAHVAALRTEGERFAVRGATLPLDAAIATCPGWSVRDLIGHVGGIHRWARAALRPARVVPISPGDAAGAAPTGGEELLRWFRDGLVAVVDELASRGPEEPTWHPFPTRPVVAAWSRRLCHETAMHRVDLDVVAGEGPRLEPSVAVDGIDELLTVLVPRRMARDGFRPPIGTLTISCPEPAARWSVRSGALYEVVRDIPAGGAPADADAVVAGPASAVLAVLARRRSRRDGVVVRGDVRVLDGWSSRSLNPPG